MYEHEHLGGIEVGAGQGTCGEDIREERWLNRLRKGSAKDRTVWRTANR